jgi:hypothetical protein
MRPFRSNSYKAPYFTPSQIDNMCCDELHGVGPLPDSPEPIRIDRFIEKRFNVSPQYEDLRDGILGFTRFGKNGVKAVVISAALDAEGGKVAARRVRTTIAHEGGHGLLTRICSRSTKFPFICSTRTATPGIRFFAGMFMGMRRRRIVTTVAGGKSRRTGQ